MKKVLLALLGVSVAGVAIWYFNQPTIEEKRAFLQTVDGTPKIEPFKSMSDQEINDSYAIVKAYQNNKSLSDSLKARMQVLSVKYNIFT